MIELLFWVLGPLALAGLGYGGYRWYTRPIVPMAPPVPPREDYKNLLGADHPSRHYELHNAKPGPSTTRSPQPIVQERSGVDPLLAGLVGYAIGRSETGHVDRAEAAPFEPGGGKDGGGGASASWSEPEPASEPANESSESSSESNGGGSEP